MKEWKCLQVGHHNKVSKTIEELQTNDRRLHTHQVAGIELFNHYLLFERGE
ncbi:MAG: hypothetical protein V3V81_02550 [Candidatus Bathyarchaeia archaeon]